MRIGTVETTATLNANRLYTISCGESPVIAELQQNVALLCIIFDKTTSKFESLQ